MKKITLLFAVLFFAALAANAQKVNEKVQVEHNGTWYPATILKINADEGTYYIKYTDWDDSWNEWVTKSRLKDFATEKPAAPLTKFKVGDKVEVEYGMIPEPATIIEVGENKYHIKYDKTAFGDKWVTEKQIKKL
jgi:transcription antitermination factor NusG